MANNQPVEIKISTNNLIKGALVLLVIIVGVIAFNASSNTSSETSNTGTQTQTTDIDGNQVIEMTAKMGYSPKSLSIEANKATILKVKTENTFDCSSALNIPSLGIQKNLPAKGITEIKIAAQKPGTTIKGTCSMGMYNFTIKVI